MRWSLRSWLLLTSIVFAALVVGGIALTSYIIVSNRMEDAAHQSAHRVARSARLMLNSHFAQGDGGASAEATASSEPFGGLLPRLPQLLGESGSGKVSFVLYDDQLKPVWSSGPEAKAPALSEARAKALATNQIVGSPGRRTDLFSGLVRQARLGVSVESVPVALPEGRRGVLDVIYAPIVEEKTIDAIRLPMAALAISALFIMVVLMQTSMAWVLNLVDNLREAADQIDAGHLDERLPESGNNEIGELAHSINSLIERLQRRSEAQSRFVADASHELATPVAGIRGYTSILREWGAEDPVVREESIDAIDRESRRMARLTGDLLNLLHADQGLVLKRVRFDLNALIRERMAATAGRWIDKDLEYQGPGDQVLSVVGDPDRIEDVISILLDNASKYTPVGGKVSVTTGRRRETVTVVVEDSGRGIPPEDLPHIFDRFFRSEASRAAGEGGFGLGLAILQSIVDSMGGSIEVASEVGQGTRFTVRLPRGRL